MLWLIKYKYNYVCLSIWHYWHAVSLPFSYSHPLKQQPKLPEGKSLHTNTDHLPFSGLLINFFHLIEKPFFSLFFSKSGLEYVGGVKWAFLTKSRNDSSVTQRGQNVSAGFTLSNMWRPVGSLMPSLSLDFMWPNLPAVNKSFDSFLGTFFSHSESKKWVNDLLHVNKHGLIQETAEKS